MGPIPRMNPHPLRSLCLALSLVLLGSAGAWWIQTQGGSVDVSGFTLPTENGQWVAADLYRPRSATASHPLPAVVICPGFERSKESLDSYAIELARREMVVVVIDPYNQGASSTTLEKRSASVEGYGVVPMVRYLASTPNLNYIDRRRIGAAGYSAGGNAVIQSAAVFGGRKGAPRRGKSASTSDSASPGERKTQAAGQNPLSAVFVGGYVMSFTDQVLSTVNSNVGTDYADHDEGAYRNGRASADLREAPESLRLVNSVLPPDGQLSRIEIGKTYGDAASRTLRVVYNTGPMIHPLLPYDTRSVAHLVDFFTVAFGLTPSLAPGNQVWWLKELFTLASLVGALWFLIPCAQCLLGLPVFRGLVRPLPPKRPAMNGRQWGVFAAIFAVSAGIAAVLFVPLCRATVTVFPQASASVQTWWFPERMNNAVLLWAVANGAIGLLTFCLVHLRELRSPGPVEPLRGGVTTLPDLARTALLALCVVASFFALLFATYAVFHTDFRFIFIAAAASFPTKLWLVALEYIPPFMVFYYANSVRVNLAGRFEGQSEWLNRLLMGLSNSVGLFAILVVQYTRLYSTGTVFWTNEWIYVNLLFGIVPLMFILPYFHRAFYQLTGRVYLGPLIMCPVFIMMAITSSVCYLPLS